jgi:hypothetical protein
MMRDLLKTGRGLWIGAALIVVVAQFAAPRAQQPPAQQPPAAQPPAPEVPQKPLVPLTVPTFLAQGETFIGDIVTVTGPVEHILAPLSFSLDADPKQATGQEALVLAPRLNAPVKANGYVTVIGRVVKFDPAELAKTVTDRKIDVPADAAAKFAGKPVLLATTIVDASFVELTRRLAPPPSADDLVLQPIMRRNQTAIGAARAAANEADMPTVRQNAALLKQSFTQLQEFFDDKDNQDGMKLAANARTSAEALEKTVATGKWDDVKAATAAVQQTCQACHAVYRERFDDGSFRLRVASK